MSTGTASEPGGWAAGALTLGLLVLVAHRALIPMEETDLFFHLRLGELILDEHRIPFRNLFSFTYPDHPDPDLSWAFQVLVALLYRLGGWAAIVLGKTALIVLAVWLVLLVARRGGAGPLAAGGALLLATVTAEPRFCERPHLVTFVGLGALLLGLQHLEGLPVGPARSRRLLLLPLLFVVWANFHAGVFLGPLVLAAYLAGVWLERRLGGVGGPGVGGPGVGEPVGLGEPPGERRRVLQLLGVSLLGLFATPATWRLPGYLLWHTGLGSTRDIDEFRVADAWNDPWFFIGIGLLLVVLLGAGPRRVPWRLALPPLLLLPLALRSVRFIAEWALLAAPLWAFGLARLGALLLSEARLPPRAAALVAAGGALGLLGVVTLARLGQPLELGLAPQVVPFEAIAFATRNGLRERLFSNLDVGCYLLWEGWPRYRVFQDARLPAYPHVFHRALDRTPLEPRPFDALLRQHGVDAALLGEVGVNARSGCFDPDEWALVYLSPSWRRQGAMVLARRIPAHGEVIARHELPWRGRFSFAEGTRLEPLWRRPARSPLDDCTWSRRLAAALAAEGELEQAARASRQALERGCLGIAEEVEVRFGEGARHQLAGRFREAVAEYDRVLVLSPGHVDTRINRGLAWLTRALRRKPGTAAEEEARRRAEVDLREGLRLAPDRADAALGLQRLQRLDRPERR